MTPGSRLPSERELADQLGVSRPSIREALGALALAGVLETKQGSGSIVAASSSNLLSTSFEMMLLIDQPSLLDLYETRELLEVHLAAAAAERRTDGDLAVIEGALIEMRKHLDNPSQMSEANVQFHLAIAAAAHMPVLERIMSCLHDGIKSCIEAASHGVRDWVMDYAGHERVYEAIKARSANDARRAMTVHMAMAVENLRRGQAMGHIVKVPSTTPIVEESDSVTSGF